MSVLQTGLATPATGYTIDNSLRFNDDDTAYLSRTPSSAGNRKTWTYSAWVKRGNLGGYHWLVGAGVSGTDRAMLMLWGSTSGTDNLTFYYTVGAGAYGSLTNSVFRDTSAWYHIVLAVDTTQATAADRVKIYVNGAGQTTTGFSSGYVPQNTDMQINNNQLNTVGRSSYLPNDPLDGYLAEVNFVDGQALTPADFGETGDYGEWKPIRYTGTYGTNGFYLDFGNSGSLGTDSSGNSNNWTPTNLAATDQMLDSPTNNFAVLNVLKDGGVITSQGNLKTTGITGNPSILSTMGMSSGKWYCEFVTTVQYNVIGIVKDSIASLTNHFGVDATGYGYYDTGGLKVNNGSFTSYGSSWSIGDIIGIAYDADAGSLTFYRNGVSQGVAFSGLSGEFFFAWGDGGNNSLPAGFWNFGQDSSFAGNKTAQGNSDGNGIGDFYYTPPTGYLALCTQNLPDPAVIPSEHFNTVLYTGNGSTQSITGVGFQPDFTWIKNRSTAGNGTVVQDVVRGSFVNGDHKVLITNNTNAEYTQAAFNDLYGSVTSLDSDGFTVDDGSNPNYDSINGSAQTYVAWNWKANGTGASNTNGTITSTVSANVDAGFSIVSYTANGVNGATIGHGLSSTPEMIIVKGRDNSTRRWAVYHKTIGNTGGLYLEATGATLTSANLWNNTSPTSSVFSVGLGGNLNTNTEDYIAYAFHSVDGYSKVGSYTGNGSSDGTFVYTGFRPAYVMGKKTNAADDWFVYDVSRDPDNAATYFLNPNTSDADDTAGGGTLDITSNGFKWRTTSGMRNQSGHTYIYMAFAEHPFKHTNAR